MEKLQRRTQLFGNYFLLMINKELDFKMDKGEHFLYFGKILFNTLK